MRRYAAKTTVVKPLNAIGARKQQVLWGDWLDVDEHPSDDTRFVLHWRRRDGSVTDYVIAKTDTRTTPLLEIIFMDVGQGDGALIGIPDGEDSKLMLIDAGSSKGDNLYRFLDWRHDVVDPSGQFHAAIITHPDEDHYGGFQSIFEDPRFRFSHVYHNGLVERVSAKEEDKLGPRADGFCLDVHETEESVRALLSDAAVRGRMRYPKLLFTALEEGRVGSLSMLGVDKGAAAAPAFMPGFAAGATAAIEVLGPLVARDETGKPRLREFGDRPGQGTDFNLGKTKNGHSVLLRLTFGKLRLIFGGDLNRASEDHLLRYYGGVDAVAPLADAIAAASERLSADLLKCCHHGSADVTDEFVRAVSPFGFIVSSGDSESHVHPRPEVLGLLGKNGRGSRPLLLCTELQRSGPEAIKLNDAEAAQLGKLRDTVLAASTAAERKVALRAFETFFHGRLKRLVDVYGAINIRTDGNRLLVAFLKEAASSSGKRWHTYLYEHHLTSWTLIDEDDASS